MLLQLVSGGRRIDYLDLAALPINASEVLYSSLREAPTAAAFAHSRVWTKPRFWLHAALTSPRRVLGFVKETRSWRGLRTPILRGLEEALLVSTGSTHQSSSDKRTAKATQATISGRSTTAQSQSLANHERTRRQVWDDVFAETDPWNYGSGYERIKYDYTLQLIPDDVGSAVELACAEGVFTQRLASRVRTLTACDISPKALSRATDRCRGLSNINFRVVDVVSDRLPQGQELIVASEFLYYLDGIEELRRVATKLRDALLPGGYLVMANHKLVRDDPSVTGFDWDQSYGAEVIKRTFSSIPGLSLERSTVTELYRVDRFRRLRPGEEVINPLITSANFNAKLDATLERHIVWGGAVKRRRDVEREVTWRVPVLAYHRIANDGPDDLKRWRVSPADFREQLRCLRSLGFHSVTSEQVARARDLGRPLFGRPIVITFDDAYQDFAETAWEILRANDFGAEVFVVTDRVGETAEWDKLAGTPAALMGWSTIVELANQGVRFGSHLATHAPATTLSTKALASELARSRNALEDHLETPVTTLAAPYGLMDLRLTQLARRAGFTVGYSCDGALADLRKIRIPRAQNRGRRRFGVSTLFPNVSGQLSRHSLNSMGEYV